MKIEASLEGVKETRLWEVALRFVFGGLTTVGAGLIARAYGPVIAGLFVCFPAILPAALTLVARHQGRPDAAADAKGAAMGSVGLAAFGLLLWCLAPRWPAAPTLVVATMAWGAIPFAVWWLLCGRKGHKAVA